MASGNQGKRIEMGEGKEKRASDLLAFLRSCLPFFVLSFVYLWFVVEPHLIYYCFGTVLPDAPLFATGWPFLKESLGTPGGPVTYVSGFLSQGYYHAWLGAAIIVLAGFCLSELTRRHLVAAGLARASVVASVPAIAFFLICSRYKHPLTICLAVSLGLLLSLVFERLPLRRPPVRVVTCCLLAALGFWLGGAGTLLLFALMIAIHRILGSAATIPGRWIAGWQRQAESSKLADATHHKQCTSPAASRWSHYYELLALPAGVAIVWALAEYVFLIPARQAFLILTPFSPSVMNEMDTFLEILVFLLYGFVPVAVLLVSIGRHILDRRAKKFSLHPRRIKGQEKHAPTQRRRLPLGILKQPVLSAVLIALMALALYLGHDDLHKPYVLSNYYCRRQQWDKILELRRHLPRDRYNVFVCHDTLRALYHTGRLPYDMFRYPLVPEAILLTHEKRQSDLTQWKLSEIFLEFGHVNVAQKLASEVVTTKSHLGVALEELGWINIIKGHPATARVYLNALKKDPIYRRRAESLLHGLDSGFAPDQAARIDRIRSCMRDETAGIAGSESLDVTLATLLAHNPRNKMAFEYLMACYMLNGRVDKIVENVERLHDLGYREIPTLYQEAILIHHGSTGQQVDLARFNISRETLQRYETFVRMISAMQTQDRQDVLNSLIRDFGTSYFFYYFFGRVGLA